MKTGRKIKSLAGLITLMILVVPMQAFALNSADLNSLQTNTNTLPYGTDQAASVKDHGFIYEIGGYTSSGTTASTYYAAANSDGSVGSWQSTASLPTALVDPTAVESNGYVYVMNGWNDNLMSAVYYNNVYLSQIQSNGTLGSWQSTTSLPVNVTKGSAVVSNGYIYFFGGINGSGSQSGVYSAPIESNGTLGSWQSTTSLPYASNGGSFFTYEGYMYFLGGYDGSVSSITNNTYSAPIESNGTLGSWQSTTSLPDSLQFASTVESDGYVYEIGGTDIGSNVTSAIYYAPINNNGTLGSWQTSAQHLATPFSFTTATTIGGYLYIIGGYNSSVEYNTVYYSLLNFTNAKLIDNAANSALILVNTASGTNLTCANSVNESSLSKQDSGDTYPLGLVNICYITDDNSDTVKLTFVTDLTPSEVIARDYNSLTQTYVTIPGATVTQSSYNGQPALILTYSVVPGGELDSSQTSGLVDDPVGLAVSSVSTSIAAPDTGFGVPVTGNPWITFAVFGSTSIGLASLGFGLRKLSKLR